MAVLAQTRWCQSNWVLLAVLTIFGALSSCATQAVSTFTVIPEAVAPAGMKEVARRAFPWSEGNVQVVIYADEGKRERFDLVQFELRLVGKVSADELYMGLLGPVQSDGSLEMFRMDARSQSYTQRFTRRVRRVTKPPARPARVEVWRLNRGQRELVSFQLDDELAPSDPGQFMWEVSAIAETASGAPNGTHVFFERQNDCRGRIRIVSNIEPPQPGGGQIGSLKRHDSWANSDPGESADERAVMHRRNGERILSVIIDTTPDRLERRSPSPVVQRRFDLPECIPDGTPVGVALDSVGVGMGVIRTFWKGPTDGAASCMCSP